MMTPPQIEWVTLQYARATRDTASFDFSPYGAGGAALWILATIRPDADSGSATIPGAHIKADSGELVVPAGASTVVVVKGQWEPLAAKPERPAVATPYSWTKPFRERPRAPTWEDIYAPFVHGGVILFVPKAGAVNLEYFGANCLIFPEWGKLVEDAFKQYDSEPALQSASDARVKDRDKLAALCSAENHLVAIVAMRKLINAGTLRPALVRDAMTAVDEHRRAAMVFLVMTNADDAKTKDLRTEVETALKSTAKVEQVRSVALGAFAAALEPQADPKVRERARALLDQVRRKQTSLGAPAKNDPALNYILERMPSASSSSAP